MNYLEPLKINNIKLNNIIYSKIKVNQNKKIILLKYNDNKIKNFVFQTPTLTNMNKAIITNDYAEIDIALIGKKKKNINSFLNFLNNLEEKIKEDAIMYSSQWFSLNDNDNDNQIINFQKIIRDNNTIKLKLIKNNDFETLVQLNNDNKINFQSIPENSWCKVILECYAIWINHNNDFGLFFRPILISFTIKEIYNYNFINEDESEDNNSSCNIPDTDINKNISNLFFKLENKIYKNNNDETSQLDCNILYNTLINNDDIHHNNIVLNKNIISDKTSDENLLKLNNNNSSSSSSNKSKSNKSNNNISSISELESLGSL
jgi:hypothetical protein